MQCKICKMKESRIIYKGKIRNGKFNDLTQSEHNVYECKTCNVRWIDKLIDDVDVYYQSSQYRSDVDDHTSFDAFYSQHDNEQIAKLEIITLNDLRNAVVCDLGSGAGSFLDFVKGVSSQTIAVEPYKEYHDELKRKGHEVYDYSVDAIEEYSGTVDVLTCFSVIEHIEDPVQFLRDANVLLKVGGKLIISTPNAEDALIDMVPEVYPSFFYRKVHLWYFSSFSIKYILEKCGFKNVVILPKQRFGMGNFLGWLSKKKPLGDVNVGFISHEMDVIWKKNLESNIKCDYLYITCEK